MSEEKKYSRDEIEVALSKTIVSLIRTKSFYGHVLAQMSKEYTYNIPTLGVGITNRLILFINPDFFMSLTTNQRVGVLEHEVDHVVLFHIIRGKDFVLQSAANVAMDIIVNQLIDKQMLPKEALYPEQFGLPRNETLPFYYEKIVQKLPKIKVRILGQGQEGKGQEGQGEGGKGKGKQGEDEGDTITVTILDDHGKWEKKGKGNKKDDDYQMSDVLKEAIIKEVVKHAKEASKGDGIGNLAGNVEEMLKPPQRAKLPWKVLLRRFLSYATRTTIDYTKKRVSKRYHTRPGIKLGSVLDIAVAIDTSGSISSAELNMFASEVYNIVRSNIASVTIIECDADVQRVYKLKGRGIITEMHGRGGTDFRPVFTHLENPQNKKDALVFFTDSQGPAPEKSRIPTLWVLTHGNKNPSTFGKEVILPEIKEEI